MPELCRAAPGGLRLPVLGGPAPSGAGRPASSGAGRACTPPVPGGPRTGTPAARNPPGRKAPLLAGSLSSQVQAPATAPRNVSEAPSV